MLLRHEEVSDFYESASQALTDVKKKMGLPLSGSIVFPFMYTSKKCFHLAGNLSSEHKKLGYMYAGGITLFGGPHMYFFFKGMEPWLIDVIFSIQVIIFIAYFFKRQQLLNRAKSIELEHSPLSDYTSYLANYANKVMLIKTLLLYTILFVLAGGFLAYSVFINGYYFLFLFLFGSLLWFSTGALIMGITLKKIIARSSKPHVQ